MSQLLHTQDALLQKVGEEFSVNLRREFSEEHVEVLFYKVYIIAVNLCAKTLLDANKGSHPH